MSFRATTFIIFGVLTQTAACGGGSSPGTQFCQEWATAFCQKVFACTPADMRGDNFLGGTSEGQCTAIWSTACSTKPPAGETFDINCSAGQPVNTAARTACLNELSTVACVDFNSPNHVSVCNQVCVAGPSDGGADSGAANGGGSGGSGGPGGGSCGQVEPCGGNLVGSWKLTNQCVNVASLQPQAMAICAEARITSATASPSGTTTFKADMTYSTSGNSTVMVEWNIPSSCLGGSTCGVFGAAVENLLGAGETFACTGDAACVCKQTAVADETESGTYTTSGTDVVITNSATGVLSRSGYCVQGLTLHLVTVDSTMSMGPMGQATIDQDIVAEKQ